MHFLQTVLEHRSVSFVEELLVDVNPIVCVDTHKVCVVSRVVDLAHAQSIWNGRYALCVSVGENVSGVKKFWVMESADRAAVFVGEKNLASEFPLMHPLFDHPLDVGA